MHRLLPAAAFAALVLALAGCSGVGTRSTVGMAAGVPTALAPGERARLPDGSQLAYLRLRSDSRCPPRVTCIHAGWAEIDTEFVTVAGAHTTLLLSTRPGAGVADTGAWRFELVELGRGPSPVARLRASAAPP